MSVLNPILSRWLEVNEKPPAVDCVNCTMAHMDQVNAKRWRDFKCCTFQPFFPNFYLGAMLEAGVSLPINGNVFVTPIGIYAKQEFREKRDAVPDEKRGLGHLCSAFKNNQCSVWSFRPGECATYYCQGDLPKRAFDTYKVESAVAQMALVHLGLTAKQTGDLVEAMESGAAVVGYGDSLALYRQAWEWARGLSRVEVQSWLG